MTEIVTKEWLWKAGQSGNPRGRPRKKYALTHLLQERGSDLVIVDGQEMPAQEALAQALWQFAVTGEVRLAGKHLKAETVSEWASVVKWLYTYIEPPQVNGEDTEHEMVVRVIHDKRPPLHGPEDSEDEVGEIEDDFLTGNDRAATQGRPYRNIK